MNQCVRITVVVNASMVLLRSLIQKNAQKLSIEGVGSILDHGTVKIIAYGPHNAIDEFIDALYSIKPSLIEVEPFIKDRDYRGIFRMIS